MSNLWDTADPAHARQLIAVIHLPALPGHPHNALSMDAILEHVAAEARLLSEAAFDGIIVENFGDAPFEGDTVLPHTVAAMTRCVHAVVQESTCAVGVNVLRNDASAALAIAAATDAAFIRINVHTGVYATDQGILEGRAARTIRERAGIAPRVRILADVHVKHAEPMSQPSIVLAAEETAYRGRADGLIVTGTTTGRAADRDAVDAVRAAVPDRPLLLGSGVTADTVNQWLDCSSGVIVGSDLRAGGRAGAALDIERVRRFVGAARS